jgi:hypothetical protein
VPGQGLLTVMVGLFLMDVPGKRKLQMALLRRPTILGGINRLRARFNRPELLLDPEPPSSAREIESQDGAPPSGDVSEP